MSKDVSVSVVQARKISRTIDDAVKSIDDLRHELETAAPSALVALDALLLAKGEAALHLQKAGDTALLEFFQGTWRTDLRKDIIGCMQSRPVRVRFRNRSGAFYTTVECAVAHNGFIFWDNVQSAIRDYWPDAYLTSGGWTDRTYRLNP